MARNRIAKGNLGFVARLGDFRLHGQAEGRRFGPETIQRVPHMAEKSFALQIYTQASKVFESSAVTSVVFPAEDGKMGVLTNHAPMLATLGEGIVRITNVSGEERSFRIGGGFFEVTENKATILTDHFYGEA